MNKDALLQSYLIVDDIEGAPANNQPIKPSFYAFGSGELEVQVNILQIPYYTNCVIFSLKDC